MTYRNRVGFGGLGKLKYAMMNQSCYCETLMKGTPIFYIDSSLTPCFAFHLQGIAGNDGKDGKPGSLGEPVM